MSGVSGILDGVSGTNNNWREGALAPRDRAAEAAALCLKLEHRVAKGTSVTLDSLRKHLTCLELY